MHALMEAATQAEYSPYQPNARYLPHPTHSRTRWSYGAGGGYTSYGGIPPSAGSGGVGGVGGAGGGAMPHANEPASFDLSVSETLAPHVITVLLTDDLLPIGTRQAGPESSQAEVSGSGGGGGGGGIGGGKQKSGYIRQISVDRSKPQVSFRFWSLVMFFWRWWRWRCELGGMLAFCHFIIRRVIVWMLSPFISLIPSSAAFVPSFVLLKTKPAHRMRPFHYTSLRRRRITCHSPLPLCCTRSLTRRAVLAYSRGALHSFTLTHAASCVFPLDPTQYIIFNHKADRECLPFLSERHEPC